MVSQGWAVKLVERYLAESAAKPGASKEAIMRVEPHRLGWMITTQGERYLRTHDHADILIGTRPLLVDGMDGSLHMVLAFAGLQDGEEWIEGYLEQVRGIEFERVDPLRSRIVALLAEGRRLDAIRTVRAMAPELGPYGAKEYVEAVVTGAPIPEHMSVHLPPLPARLVRHSTLTGPNPEPTA